MSSDWLAGLGWFVAVLLAWHVCWLRLEIRALKEDYTEAAQFFAAVVDAKRRENLPQVISESLHLEIIRRAVRRGGEPINTSVRQTCALIGAVAWAVFEDPVGSGFDTPSKE